MSDYYRINADNVNKVIQSGFSFHWQVYYPINFVPPGGRVAIVVEAGRDALDAAACGVCVQGESSTDL
jgi:hypothetical protein